MRQLQGNSHLAEDVTQAVFILLARKVASLRRDVVLREWLFITTRYAAKNALKMEARRRYHERHAAAQRQDLAATESSPQQMIPLLDEAIARLRSSERAGVLLSFFDNKTYREVGQTLGVSEEAARKRVARAVQKMRDFFVSRGVTVPSAMVVTSVRLNDISNANWAL
jgi:RNA polymerase sigma factor (sigma-70 family)